MLIWEMETEKKIEQRVEYSVLPMASLHLSKAMGRQDVVFQSEVSIPSSF